MVFVYLPLAAPQAVCQGNDHARGPQRRGSHTWALPQPSLPPAPPLALRSARTAVSMHGAPSDFVPVSVAVRHATLTWLGAGCGGTEGLVRAVRAVCSTSSSWGLQTTSICFIVLFSGGLLKAHRGRLCVGWASLRPSFSPTLTVHCKREGEYGEGLEWAYTIGRGGFTPRPPTKVTTVGEKRNRLAEVVRSKLGRPVYRGKRHIPPPSLGLFGPIRVPYPKGLNC